MASAAATTGRFAIFIHAIAACGALGLGAWLSTTAFVQTGVQFVGPAVVILLVHLFALWRTNDLMPGFSVRLFSRSFATSAGLAGLMLLGSLVLPTPVEAQVNDAFMGIFTVLFCVVVMLLVGGVIFLVARFVYMLIWGALNAIRKDDDDPSTRLFDFGALALTGTVMLGSALEGLPQTYTFPKADEARATVEIDAPSAKVWAAMETATAPQVPLPAILGAFPKPVDVVVDEGTGLGARREVAFSGREGAGRLKMEVTHRDATRTQFTVLSDTSPYAMWIGFRGLTYEVAETQSGTALTVALSYDRDLSPAWFFGPMMRGAGHFAMRVLARDVQARAEG